MDIDKSQKKPSFDHLSLTKNGGHTYMYSFTCNI